MLFETDSDQLILYYNGAWLSFGATAQAASTVLDIDIGVGTTEEVSQYFDNSFTGDWGVDTSIIQATPIQIKTTRGVHKYKNPAFDASDRLYNKQSTVGELHVAIRLDASAMFDMPYSDANSSQITIVSPHDILTTTQTKNNHNAIYVTHGALITEDPVIKSRNNIIMQSDVDTVTNNTNYPTGTIVNSTLENGDSHIGFAVDPTYGRSKDVTNGVTNTTDSYTLRSGIKSYVSKTYRDTQNTMLSAGPHVYGAGGGNFENRSDDHVTTIWFKLSATDPLVETNTTRFIYGLAGHCSVEAVSAGDGSGWYLHLDEMGNQDPVIPSPELKLEEDTWYNTTMSITGGPPAQGRDIRLYLDGQLVHTDTAIRTTYIRQIGTQASGHTSSTGAQALNGMWTGWAAWNHPLSESQIDLISNNTNLTSLFPDVPEPISWMHPLNDPYKLLGVLDTKTYLVEDFVLENRTQALHAYSSYWKQTSIDDHGREPFPSDVVIYSEEHPTK